MKTIKTKQVAISRHFSYIAKEMFPDEVEFWENELERLGQASPLYESTKIISDNSHLVVEMLRVFSKYPAETLKFYRFLKNK